MNKYENGRTRKIQVIVRMNEQEHDRLCEWSAACRTSKSDYIRSLICGIRPVEFPPMEYREIINQLCKIGINMNQLAVKAHSLGFIDEPQYRENAKQVWQTVELLSEQLNKAGVKFGSH